MTTNFKRLPCSPHWRQHQKYWTKQDQKDIYAYLRQKKIYGAQEHFSETPTEYIQDAEDTTVPLGGQFNLRLC